MRCEREPTAPENSRSFPVAVDAKADGEVPATWVRVALFGDPGLPMLTVALGKLLRRRVAASIARALIMASGRQVFARTASPPVLDRLRLA